jgi:hypothetical protein
VRADLLFWIAVVVALIYLAAWVINGAVAAESKTRAQARNLEGLRQEGKQIDAAFAGRAAEIDLGVNKARRSFSWMKPAKAGR